MRGLPAGPGGDPPGAKRRPHKMNGNDLVRMAHERLRATSHRDAAIAAAARATPAWLNGVHLQGSRQGEARRWTASHAAAVRTEGGVQSAFRRRWRDIRARREVTWAAAGQRRGSLPRPAKPGTFHTSPG